MTCPAAWLAILGINVITEGTNVLSRLRHGELLSLTNTAAVG